MPAPIWSPRSLADLSRIQAHFDAFDEDLAQQAIRSIRATTLRLIDHPRFGPPINDRGLRKLSVRRFSYVVLYRVSGTGVRILRVRHTSENWR